MEVFDEEVRQRQVENRSQIIRRASQFEQEEQLLIQENESESEAGCHNPTLEVNISNDDEVEEDESLYRVREEMDETKIMNLLVNLIEKLPEYQQERFSPVLIFPGLLSWLAFYRAARSVDCKVQQNLVYENWYREHVMKAGSPECNKQFAALFQNIQIRSCSEVRK